MREFLTMMIVQGISYLNLTINFRAIAHRQYIAAIVTDGLASAISYVVVKRIAKSDSRWSFWGMVVGGSMASTLGIYLTRHWG